jgi:hypothetical protein
MSLYLESQDLIARADAAQREGDRETARRLLREAADLQQKLAETRTPGRARTREVFLRSADALRARAKEIDNA